MIKRVFTLLILIFILSVSAGCYNYREIEHLSIVAGCAIDKGTINNRIRLTIELVDMSSSGKSDEIKPKLIETEGMTVFEAMRNAENSVSRELYWSNCQVIILGSDVAREGILEVLDIFKRGYEVRPTVDVIVSQAQTAKEILSLKSINSPITSFDLDLAVESNPNRLSTTVYTEVYEVLNKISTKSNALTLPAVKSITNNGEQTWTLNGVAIFDEDKLAGFLEPLDTKYMNFVLDEVKGGILTESAGVGGTKDSTLEIFKNKTKLSPEYKDGQLKMTIDTETVVSVVELGSELDFTVEENQRLLSKAVEASLEGNIKRVIDDVKMKYGTDIFFIGNKIQQTDPKLWDNLKDNWKETFKNMEVKVNSKVIIKNSGLTKKPIKAGEQE